MQHKQGGRHKFSMTSGPVSLTEPVSSCLYLASSSGQSQLTGKTPSDQASVLQWLLYSAGDLKHSVGGWVLPTMEQCEGANQGTVNRSKADLVARLDVLDKCLVTKTFLVGERISLADIGMAMTLLPAFTEVLDQAFRSSHRHLTRWFNTIIHQEVVVKVIGTVKLCVKEAEMKQGAKKEKKKEEPKKKKMIPRSQVRNQWKCRLNLRKRIHLTLFLKEPLTWKIGKDSTLTMMRIKAANTFGPSLTPHVTLSGEGTTGITRSSVRSSCLATSWEECSRGWRSSRKTHSHLPCSLARTTIAPSLLFGFSKDSSWLLT